MSEKYKIYNNSEAYFVTSTIVDWYKLFTERAYYQIIIDSLNYCIRNKGLEIYSWCLMPNHLHMICRAISSQSLSDILRDFKTHTSKSIIKHIKMSANIDSNQLLIQFSEACSHLKNQRYKVWQDGNHPKEIYSSGFLYEKLNYIHNNPVKAGIVENPWDYQLSSARDYAGYKGLIEVVLLDHKPLINNW